MNELNKTEEIDLKYFWHLMSRRKLKIITPISNEDGEIITDPTQIQKEWNKYYEKLYSECDDDYDNEFKEKVEREVQHIENSLKRDHLESYLTGGPITLKDTDEIIKTLPNNKAAGYDMMSSEHLKHSGVVVKSIVTWLLNGIIKLSEIPARLKKGLIISIPKPEKDSLIKDNNRGLTLLPTIYKLLEKVIIKRESAWVDETISPIQSCGKDHISCTHTSFLVQQAVTTNINRGRSVFGGFLDTQKAFDTLWIIGLLYKLYKEKINPKAWLLIQNAYTGFKCSAYVNGIYGPWFSPQRGVHQGGPLSMILYTVYVNDLLKQLSNSSFGICIRNQMLTSPAHCDDVAMLSVYKTGLNALFAIAMAYSIKWRYTYNKGKTIYMIWGKDEYPHIDVVFGGQILLPKSECKHMGITLTTADSNKKEICQTRIGKAKQVLFMGLGIGGLHVTTSPNTMSRLYWSIAVPKMVYGLETTPISESNIDLLENAHRQHANLIQGLRETTPKPASIALLGWQSIRSFIAYLKIMFMIRTLCLDPSSLYRKVMIIGIDTYEQLNGQTERVVTPIYDIMKYVKYYGLSNIITKCKTSGTWKMLGNLKVIVKKTVLEYDERQWKVTNLLYRGLSLYRSTIKYRKLCVWWSYVQYRSDAFRRVSAVVALICDTQPNGYGANFGRNARCQICDLYELDSIYHIMFHCSSLNGVRDTHINELRRSMPTAMRNEYDQMSNQQKLTYLLSGLNSDKYVPEWQEVYYRISNLVFEIYKCRSAKYKELSDELEG